MPGFVALHPDYIRPDKSRMPPLRYRARPRDEGLRVPKIHVDFC